MALPHGLQLFFSRQKTDLPKMKVEKISVESKYEDKETSRKQANPDYL